MVVAAVAAAVVDQFGLLELTRFVDGGRPLGARVTRHCLASSAPLAWRHNVRGDRRELGEVERGDRAVGVVRGVRRAARRLDVDECAAMLTGVIYATSRIFFNLMNSTAGDAYRIGTAA